MLTRTDFATQQEFRSSCGLNGKPRRGGHRKAGDRRQFHAHSRARPISQCHVAACHDASRTLGSGAQKHEKTAQKAEALLCASSVSDLPPRETRPTNWWTPGNYPITGGPVLRFREAVGV